MQDMETRFFLHEKINYEKLGKWLKGWQRRKQFSKREMMSIMLGANLFCNSNEIRTAADLVTHFREKKKEIKSKKGRTSTRDNKILALKYSSLIDRVPQDTSV